MPNNNRQPRHATKARIGANNSVPQIVTNLPQDPPTLNVGRPKTLQVLETGVAASSQFILDYPKLVGLIRSQHFAGATAAFKFQLLQVSVWGSAGDARSLRVTESLFGVSGADTGSFSTRPKVGISYPPTARVLSDNDTTGNIATIGATPANSQFSVSYKMLVWTIPTYDF